MGRSMKIEYTCDRCGKIITGTPYSIWRFQYIHVFKWYVPQSATPYPLRYICKDCFKSFKKWYYTMDGERRDGDA